MFRTTLGLGCRVSPGVEVLCSVQSQVQGWWPDEGGSQGGMRGALPPPGLWPLHLALTLPWQGQLVTQKNLLFQSRIEVSVRVIMWNKVLLFFLESWGVGTHDHSSRSMCASDAPGALQTGLVEL